MCIGTTLESLGLIVRVKVKQKHILHQCMFETWTEYGLTSIAIFIGQCAQMEGLLLLKEICEVRLAMGQGRIEGSERQTKKQRN